MDESGVLSMSHEMDIVFEGSGREVHFKVKGYIDVSFLPGTDFWKCSCEYGTIKISVGASADCRHVIACRQFLEKMVRSQWQKRKDSEKTT
jgi:hypothetical protein